MKDLIVLLADKDAENALQTLLRERTDALGIRPLEFDVFAHPQHDPGVLRDAPALLRARQPGYHHALVLLDREGCGREQQARAELEDEIQQRLNQSGWADRSAVIVLDPELESWVWQPTSRVAQVLGWKTWQELSAWASKSGRWEDGEAKPSRPKELMQAALREKQIAWSSSLFAQLAQSVSTRRCADQQFGRLVEVLRRWFPRQALIP